MKNLGLLPPLRFHLNWLQSAVDGAFGDWLRCLCPIFFVFALKIPFFFLFSLSPLSGACSIPSPFLCPPLCFRKPPAHRKLSVNTVIFPCQPSGPILSFLFLFVLLSFSLSPSPQPTELSPSAWSLPFTPHPLILPWESLSLLPFLSF